MCQGQCHWPIYPSLLPSLVPSTLLALYFMVELYLHAMVPKPRPVRPSGACQNAVQGARCWCGNSCWNWQRWRGHRCERWPGLIICRWFLSWPLLLFSSYGSCAALLALLACLACLVCLPVCLSVRPSVCLFVRPIAFYGRKAVKSLTKVG